MAKALKQVNSIPKKIELFGRTVQTVIDDRLNLEGNYGQSRYGVNHIALTNTVRGVDIAEEELKLTYLHEMLHFILNFTGYQEIIREGGKIELEQFIELLAAGIYQYEKTAEY